MGQVDHLTGWPTREGLLQLATQIWKTPGRLNKGLTLLFCDVTSLYWIREEYGISAAETVLIETANILGRTFRASDPRGRLGDEEFVVLAVGAPAATGPILVSRLEKVMQAYHAGDELLDGLSLSVGLAHADLKHPCSFEELLSQADSQVRIQPWIVSSVCNGQKENASFQVE